MNARGSGEAARRAKRGRQPKKKKYLFTQYYYLYKLSVAETTLIDHVG